MLHALGVLGTTIALGLLCGLALPGCEPPDPGIIVRICASGTEIYRYRNGHLATNWGHRVESIDVCEKAGEKR